MLLAARDLFTVQGYPATTVSDIAARAGVSLDTVYASVGRKPQLLLAAHDMLLAEGDDPVPAEQRAYVRAVREAPDCHTALAVYAEALGRLLPRTAPLAEALRVAGLTDEDCRSTWQRLDERRAANMRLLAADLRSKGGVRDDLDDDAVADLVWSMNSPAYYLLITSRGHDYASWVLDVWTRTLLRTGQAG